MNYLLELINNFLASYGMLAVFVVGILEEILFVVPSSLVFLAAGFLLIDPGVSFWAALLLIIFKLAFWGALGVTVGSFFIYGIFYWGGDLVVKKWGKYLGVKEDEIEKVRDKFTKGRADEIVIFVLRAFPFWSIAVVSAFSGLIKIPWRSFALFTFLGAIVRIFILGFLGWGLGEAYGKIGDRLDYWEYVGTGGLVIIVIGAFYWFFIKRRRSNEIKKLIDGK